MNEKWGEICIICGKSITLYMYMLAGSSRNIALLGDQLLLSASVKFLTLEQFAWNHKQDGSINQAQWG